MMNNSGNNFIKLYSQRRKFVFRLPKLVTFMQYLVIFLISLTNSYCSSLPVKNKFSNNETLVSDISELNYAITFAKPGDTIIMRDGVWHNSVIDFNSTASPSDRITLRAQTPGNVILNGNSSLTFSKPYLTAEGLLFKNGALENGSVISFNSDYCRLTSSAIVDYNPAEFDSGYYWIFFNGNNNRMDHCLLKGKSNFYPVVQNSEENSKYNTVDYCYIKDIPYAERNGREIFRIFGYGHADQTGDDGAYFTIEYNLFDHAHGEGTEIISFKSNFNIARYNTVRASKGGLVSRRGRNNTFEGNFIFGENVERTTGIRVAAQNHRVINNYICDVAEDGIRLIAGEYYPKNLTNNFKSKLKDLPAYIQVQNGYFAHNTVINAGGAGINIGYNYKFEWPDLQMVLIPEKNILVNNIVYNCKNNSIKISVQDKEPPLDFLTFKPNRFEGNIIFGGIPNTNPLPAGIKIIDPNLVPGRDGLYRLSQNSPAVDSGVKSGIADDMDGQVRDNKKDIGADEYSGAKIIHHPLTPDEVGPEWIIKKRKQGERF